MTRDGLVRHLDQIQEGSPRLPGARLGSWALVSISVGCVAFAAITHYHRGAPGTSKRADPLGELLAKSNTPPSTSSSDIAGRDVTFPAMLSDEMKTTTALAAVRDEKGVASIAENHPPPPADRLPVVPLPAKNIVAASPIVTRPRDALTQMAKDVSSPTGAAVDEGRPGGYQLQASSFRNEGEAAVFVTALRQRGHHAYMEPAAVAGRGTWYRVRVGPFHSRIEASQYRTEFERREHLVPFIVEPPREPAVGSQAAGHESSVTTKHSKTGEE